MSPVPSFVGLCLLLLVGKVLRTKVRLLQRLYLPSCVIGGLVGLVVIQASRASGHPLPAVWTLGWGKLPGFLINIAFACKQLVHEPFMGGGLWTSTAIPLLAIWGGWPVFGISVGAVVIWLAVAFLPRLVRRR